MCMCFFSILQNTDVIDEQTHLEYIEITKEKHSSFGVTDNSSTVMWSNIVHTKSSNIIYLLTLIKAYYNYETLFV